MARFVGYLNRRPYLWFVDCDSNDIEPAAELKDIPQGIDEVVVIERAVAVRCGPTWFALECDLSGRPRPLHADELPQVQSARSVIELHPIPDHRQPELHLPLSNGRTLHLSHPKVHHWGYNATWSPDRAYVAVSGSTVPLPALPDEIDFEARLDAEPHVLALVTAATGEVRTFLGTFEHFAYPPAWTADGSHIYLGAPYEPKRIYVAAVVGETLEPITFRRHAPTPMLDADLLPTP